jgi:hypothetical protein
VLSVLLRYTDSNWYIQTPLVPIIKAKVHLTQEQAVLADFDYAV